MDKKILKYLDKTYTIKHDTVYWTDIAYRRLQGEFKFDLSDAMNVVSEWVTARLGDTYSEVFTFEPRKGEEMHWVKGKLHRDDAPAWVRPNGEEFWYQHGKLHREDGPAATHALGIKEWYNNGKRIDRP